MFEFSLLFAFCFLEFGNKMLNKYIITIFICSLLIAPSFAMALDMPQSGNDLAVMEGVSAQAYFVQDVNSGQVIISKNADMPWTPASLTKLVTALVVLDQKVKLTKTVVITTHDQTLGACTSGGACIKAKPGVKFTVDGLFHAALLPSANNAASALAESTGLSMDQFVALMNQKAADLGATGSHFNEPTGMDPTNKITAQDYAKIVTAAFSNSYLRGIAGLSSYALRSTNNSRYNQTIKSTDKLLTDSNVQILGAKTGYLDEAKYNFASLIKYDGQELAVVVLGENHLYTAFDETKMLAGLASVAQILALFNPAGSVLGTTTIVSNTNLKFMNN
jgi:serine-type D-Ala-D-Ala carboxypeptidase (penicillin-binding protein 5/6)